MSRKAESVAAQRADGPVLVRVPIRREPHHNWQPIHWLRTLLLLLGLIGVGYYGYQVADDYEYQGYQNWAFDQQITDQKAPTFLDYLRAKTPLGAVLSSAPTTTDSAAQTAKPQPARPAVGTLLGRIAVPRLHLSAIVREGADTQTLAHAVGHVVSTALPGTRGNVAIAAHRDTLFRALKDIQLGDVVTFETPKQSYSYRVFYTRIVKPSEVSVLRPDGGFGAAGSRILAAEDRPKQLLTMITCYPFYYVGAAPRRFIVTAKLISSAPRPAVQG